MQKIVWLGVLASLCSVGTARGVDPWLVLRGKSVTIDMGLDLSLSVFQQSQDPIWRSVNDPAVTVQFHESIPNEPSSRRIPLEEFDERTVEDFNDGIHEGHRIHLRCPAITDAQIVLILAVSQQGELMVEVEQVGGRDTVQLVADLYTWAIEPAANSYTLVPVGSGYIVRSDSDQDVTLGGFVGAAYSLPLFGMVRGDRSMYQIVETWWDAHVAVTHRSQKGTVVNLEWKPSLGALRYARRVLVRFGENLDHVGIAKAYRRYLIERDQFTTLKQQAEELPSLRAYLSRIEYRVLFWKHDQHPQTLENIRRFQNAGLPIAYFFPKFGTRAWWQDYLEPNPVPEGWPAILEHAAAVRDLGCTIKLFIDANRYFKDRPGYDPSKATGKSHPGINSHAMVEANGLVLEVLSQRGFPCDALYFDAFSAHSGHVEHQSPRGPVSRRQTFESQIACFRQTRKHGIVPGGELGRFWAVGECPFFFFTDWSSDRLRQGEPIPLFPLIFHDCYGAHFSGGGYDQRHDWYPDRHPRLYELMYVAIPSYNWITGSGLRPIRSEDWQSEALGRRIEWLKLWHAYYQKICYAEMTSHQFLNAERTRQRIEFANGVIADFDLAEGMFRVKGVEEFTGDWQRPVDLEP